MSNPETPEQLVREIRYCLDVPPGYDPDERKALRLLDALETALGLTPCPHYKRYRLHGGGERCQECGDQQSVPS